MIPAHYFKLEESRTTPKRKSCESPFIPFSKLPSRLFRSEETQIRNDLVDHGQRTTDDILALALSLLEEDLKQAKPSTITTKRKHSSCDTISTSNTNTYTKNKERKKIRNQLNEDNSKPYSGDQTP